MTRLEENTPSGVQEGKSSWSCFACGAKRGWGESEGCCGLRKFEDLYILDGDGGRGGGARRRDVQWQTQPDNARVVSAPVWSCLADGPFVAGISLSWKWKLIRAQCEG